MIRSTVVLVTLIAAACSQQAPRSDSASTAPTPDTAAHTGTVVVGKAPASATGSPTIVVFEPRHSAPLPEPAMTPYMDQLSRNFMPSILIVRTGRPALFLNSDEELHNVNVKNGRTHEQTFNVALPPGINYRHTFEQPGVYDVRCDVHSAMSAQIIAASTPYVAFAEANGNFEIPNVVPGTYGVTVYAGAEPIEKKIEVKGSRIEVDLR